MSMGRLSNHLLSQRHDWKKFWAWGWRKRQCKRPASPERQKSTWTYTGYRPLEKLLGQQHLLFQFSKAPWYTEFRFEKLHSTCSTQRCHIITTVTLIRAEKAASSCFVYPPFIDMHLVFSSMSGLSSQVCVTTDNKHQWGRNWKTTVKDNCEMHVKILISLYSSTSTSFLRVLHSQNICKYRFLLRFSCGQLVTLYEQWFTLYSIQVFKVLHFPCFVMYLFYA